MGKIKNFKQLINRKWLNILQHYQIFGIQLYLLCYLKTVDEGSYLFLLTVNNLTLL